MAKILIIDDDETMTKLLKALVKMEGHIPTAVNDSTKAMEVAGLAQPDLITLDLMMPGLSGFDLCELLRQDSRFAGVPIIIVSARDDSESRARALKAGAAAYMTKPFDADEFMQKIQELTSKRNL